LNNTAQDPSEWFSTVNKIKVNTGEETFWLKLLRINIHSAVLNLCGTSQEQQSELSERDLSPDSQIYSYNIFLHFHNVIFEQVSFYYY